MALDPSQRIIRWQEIIQIDNGIPRLDANVKATISALETLQNSATGQTLFAKLKTVQSLIPAGMAWGPAGFTPEYENESVYASLLRRSPSDDPHKLLLTMQTKILPDGQSAGFYYLRAHTLGLVFPGASGLRTIRVDPTTHQTAYAPASLSETLSHELQHTIDKLEEAFNHGPRYSPPCSELRAVQTQSRYSEEIAPQAPRPHAYADPDFELRQMLDTKGLLGKPVRIDTLENMRQVFLSLARKVKLAEGCEMNMTHDQVIERTRELLIKYRFRVDDITPEQWSSWVHAPQIENVFPIPTPAAPIRQ